MTRHAMIELFSRGHLKTLIAKLLFLFSVVVLSVSCTIPVTQRDRIIIVEQSNTFGLSVPASELQMIFPKGGLRREEVNVGGGTNNPRYFYFSDRSTDFILSGWFEPAGRFTSTKSMFDEWNAKKKAEPSLEPRDLEFKKIAGWDCVVFTNSLGSAQRRHIRAHWIQDGTWIDLHISVRMNAESSAHDFLSAVKVIKIAKK
jgi:hypothetical protein